MPTESAEVTLFLDNPQVPLSNNQTERCLWNPVKLVSLCITSSSARNLERPIIARIATRAPGAPLIAA